MIETPPLGFAPRRIRALWLALPMLLCLIAGGAAHAQDQSEAVGERLERAEEALKNSEYALAARELGQAAAMGRDPNVAKQATRLAYTYGFNEQALESAERWLELDEDNEEALLYVAQLNLRLGKLGPARRSFSKLIKGADGPAEQRLLSLIPILSDEDPKNADRLMRRLAGPYRRHAYGQYAMAVMALQAGEAEDARDYAERAIEIEPEWIKPKLLFARALMMAGDEAAAIDYAARIVGDDPQPDPEARLELAIMYLSAGRDDDALSQVNQVLLEQPSRSDALRMLAIINFRLENLDAAWDDFEDLLKSGRYTMDALYYLGRIADLREETSRAIALYSQVERGQNVEVAQRRASALIAKDGDEEAALEHLEEFGEAHPNHAVDMLVARAQLLASLERYDEALESYDQVIAFRPDDESAMLGRGELLVRMERIDDALAQYRAAVKMFPDSASSMNALGYTLADRTERYGEAARLVRKALKLDPGSPAIIDSLGWVLYRQGKLDEALVQLKLAYEGFPDAEVAAHIVEVLWQMDRDDEALAMLEQAEAKSPDHPLLKDIRDRAYPDAAQ